MRRSPTSGKTDNRLFDIELNRLNRPLRKSLIEYSKSGHFYFGETGHFYLGLTVVVIPK